jgi:hypothetical protein
MYTDLKQSRAQPGGGAFGKKSLADLEELRSDQCDGQKCARSPNQGRIMTDCRIYDNAEHDRNYLLGETRSYGRQAG